MAEAAVWTMLRHRRFEAFKFRRQMPIGPYVAVFCCPSLKLIIERDGGVHALRTESDARRDHWLTAVAGFTVLRFGNEAILNNPALLFDAVREQCGAQTLNPAVSPLIRPLRGHLLPQGEKEGLGSFWRGRVRGDR